jgi:predicted lipoprotein with Yx(FWY)xxD motif
MKRAQAILAGALTLAACAAAYAAPMASAQPLDASAHSSRAVTVTLRHTSLGSILVNSSGATVYEFTRDRGDKDSCMSVSGCTAVWPPLRTSGRPVAGPGVKASLLSTITLSGGVKQVTYAGHPLYLYTAGGAGETSYVGVSSFGGTWDALSATGATVK